MSKDSSEKNKLLIIGRIPNCASFRKENNTCKETDISTGSFGCNYYYGMMNRRTKEEKIEFLEKCYNEDTHKYEIPCKCGIIHKLNHIQVFVINMHRLRCKTCNNIIID